MELWGWVAQNWFNVLSALGVIGGVWFTGVSLRSEANARRASNLIALTEGHRDIWSLTYQNIDLSRILDASADIKSMPLSHGEEMYVNAMIQHLFCVYQTMQNELTIRPEKICADVRALFSLPIPKAVWGRLKRFQDGDFVQFVENCLRE